MFVGIASIQKSMGVSAPQVVAWIALACHMLVPIVTMGLKYFPEAPKEVIISASTVIALSLVFFVAGSAKKYEMRIEGNKEKDKLLAVFLVSIFLVIGVARYSPELSVVSYLIFCLIPLKRLIGLPIHRVVVPGSHQDRP